MPKYSTIVEAIECFFNTLLKFSKEQIESRLETLEILEDKEFAERLLISIEQERNGKIVRWSDAIKQLDW